MKIFVIPGTYSYSNIGDTAMFQIAINRLRENFPLSRLATFSLRQDLLYEISTDVASIGIEGRDFWHSFKELLSPLSRLSPKILSSIILQIERKVRIHYPLTFLQLCNLRRKILRHNYPISLLQEFIDAILKSNLIVVSGMGGIHDSHGGAKRTFRLLDIIEMAIIHGIPVVLLGQGIGPIEDQTLLARAKQVLPRTNFIAVREKLASLPLLLSMGVDPGKIAITGDDAIELAYRARRSELGNAIGVGIRATGASMIQDRDLLTIKELLYSVAQSLGAKILPIPIMNDNAVKDYEAIKRLLEGFDDLSDAGASLNTPEQVLRNVSQCRVVVAGSYHASVFALAQGVPSIGLARTKYYENKLKGVSDMFGNHCDVLNLNEEQFEERFIEAFWRAWHDADKLRPKLLELARSQVEMGRQVYSQLPMLVNS